MKNMTILVSGAAGFIGSHLVDRLLEMNNVVLGIDNFSRGTSSNLSRALKSNSFKLIEGDVSTREFWDKFSNTESASRSVDVVWHLAANSDIGAGIQNSRIDLKDTFLTTYETLEFCKRNSIREFLFASSSAIYGEHDRPLSENSGPCLPISNYGAMKLASEGAVSAAAEVFLERSWIFRFPNVIGDRATHGIIYDLLNKIDKNSDQFEVLGDGSQRKPYLHVSELIDAMLFSYMNSKQKLSCFNVGVNLSSTTVKFIAETVQRKYAPTSRIVYSGGSKGWVGDVSKVEFLTDKINGIGWYPRLTSNQAVELAIDEIIAERAQGRR